MEIDLDKQPSQTARLIFNRNERDAYHDRGTPVTEVTPDGRCSRMAFDGFLVSSLLFDVMHDEHGNLPTRLTLV